MPFKPRTISKPEVTPTIDGWLIEVGKYKFDVFPTETGVGLTFDDPTEDLDILPESLPKEEKASLPEETFLQCLCR